MIFPSLRCPVARTRPKCRLKQPTWLKVLRVTSTRRRRDQSSVIPKVEKLNVSNPRTGRATNAAAETSA